MNCPKCQSTHFVKNGHINEKQRYKCKKCNYQWTENHKQRGRPMVERAFAVFLYCHGLSMNAFSKILDTAPSTILKWLRNFSNQHAQTPEPQTDAAILELDEMWHYLQKDKLWIWKAFCRDTVELIAWECGVRDKATLKKLLKRLKNWKVEIYYTDDWKPYKSLIPAGLLVQTKAETHAIERNNCQMRHWFERFKRKAIIVSKCLEMVNTTIALFARFVSMETFLTF